MLVKNALSEDGFLKLLVLTPNGESQWPSVKISASELEGTRFHETSGEYVDLAQLIRCRLSKIFPWCGAKAWREKGELRCQPRHLPVSSKIALGSV
ncbi:hypothetical protein AVEN_118009-1 [Araneus ventricosus]|uniref:Uncharacterized protein n=1 Tax=Araneus ventricosus TaxID=182803 RepID=A0A4Y2CA55_ARAVE|nr:hypothetical protein AVEN_118009-1 [Araneus ventricosus]